MDQLSAKILTPSACGTLVFTATLFLVLFAPPAWPQQQPGIMALSNEAVHGEEVDVLFFLSTGDSPIAAAQFDLLLTSDVTVVSITAGQAALAAEKEIADAPVSGGHRLIIWGMNMNEIASGVIAIIRLRVSAAPTTTLIPLQLTGVLGADAAGSAVTMTSSDGHILLEVQLGAAIPYNDFDGDGTTDIVLTSSRSFRLFSSATSPGDGTVFSGASPAKKSGAGKTAASAPFKLIGAVRTRSGYDWYTQNVTGPKSAAPFAKFGKPTDTPLFGCHAAGTFLPAVRRGNRVLIRREDRR